MSGVVCTTVVATSADGGFLLKVTNEGGVALPRVYTTEGWSVDDAVANLMERLGVDDALCCGMVHLADGDLEYYDVFSEGGELDLDFMDEYQWVAGSEVGRLEGADLDIALGAMTEI